MTREDIPMPESSHGTLALPRYITDADGNRLAAIVSIDVYERLLDAYEDQADRSAIVDYEAHKAHGTLEAVPLDQYLAERQGVATD